MNITADEMDALGTTATLYNQILALDDEGKHPYDVPELVFHIHSIQRIIMARSVRRALPCTFNSVEPGGQPAREVVHGRTCPKVKHEVRGLMHRADDDGPYDVDGVNYCGRCHEVLP